jgi:hypothetical protein
MGLNQNKGEKILLRLRTDDLKGFRKILSIRKVLCHELAHNIHSEHDDNFYILMRQIEKDIIELNWQMNSNYNKIIDNNDNTYHNNSNEVTTNVDNNNNKVYRLRDYISTNSNGMSIKDSQFKDINFRIDNSINNSHISDSMSNDVVSQQSNDDDEDDEEIQCGCSHKYDAVTYMPTETCNDSSNDHTNTADGVGDGEINIHIQQVRDKSSLEDGNAEIDVVRDMSSIEVDIVDDSANVNSSLITSSADESTVTNKIAIEMVDSINTDISNNATEILTDQKSSVNISDVMIDKLDMFLANYISTLLDNDSGSTSVNVSEKMIEIRDHIESFCIRYNNSTNNNSTMHVNNGDELIETLQMLLNIITNALQVCYVTSIYVIILLCFITVLIKISMYIE